MKRKPDIQAHGCVACRACFIEHCTICYYCIEPDIELTKIAQNKPKPMCTDNVPPFIKNRPEY